MYRIAVGVGSAYTDWGAVDEAGATTARKARSAPDDHSVGVIGSLCTVAAELRLGWLSTLLARTPRLVYGSTVATNVMVERRGARTGLYGNHLCWFLAVPWPAVTGRLGC
jgi:N-methylhydantoinase A